MPREDFWDSKSRGERSGPRCFVEGCNKSGDTHRIKLSGLFLSVIFCAPHQGYLDRIARGLPAELPKLSNHKVLVAGKYRTPHRTDGVYCRQPCSRRGHDHECRFGLDHKGEHSYWSRSERCWWPRAVAA